MRRARRVLAAAVLACFAAGCPRLAVVELDKIEARSGDPVVQARFDRARASFGAGDYSTTRSEMAAIAAAHPEDPVAPAARVMEGRAALALGDFAGALAALEPLASPPGEVGSGIAAQARYFAALAKLKLGRDGDAVRELEPFRERIADPGERLFLAAALAEAYVRLGDAERAILRYGELWARTDLEHEKVYAADRARALALGPLGPDGARRLWERAGKDGDSFAGAFASLRLALDALAAGRLDEARALLADSAEKREELAEAGRLPPGVTLPGEAGDAPRKADPRAVGLVIPLTGKAAPVGRSMLRGALVAAARNGLRVVARDSEGPGGAAGAVDELAAAGVVGILGAHDEPTARAAAARAAEIGVPFVSLAPASGVGDPASGVFRLYPPPEAEARALATFAARERGITKLAIFRPENDFGRRMATAFRAGLADAGGAATIVAEVAYADAVTAFAPEVAKLPAAGWDAIFVPDSARRLALIAPALASAGYWSGSADTPVPKKGRTVLLLLPGLTARPELLTTSSRYVAHAIIATSFHPADTSAETKAFVGAWRAGEAGDPDAPAALAYDATALLGALGKAEGGVRPRVKDALGRLDGFPGVTGPLKAGAGGGLTGPLRLLEVRGEAFVMLSTLLSALP